MTETAAVTVVDCNNKRSFGLEHRMERTVLASVGVYGTSMGNWSPKRYTDLCFIGVFGC